MSPPEFDSSEATRDMIIRPAVHKDAHAVCEIYNHYIANTIVTFEDEPVDADEMWRRIESKKLWLVGEVNDHVIGYAYAGEWRPRKAYEQTVESTIYLDDASRGNGFGIRLYSTLLAELTKTNARTVIGGVALPNDASIALHEKLGFKKVSHYKQVGFKFNKWIDVAFFQLMLADTEA